MRKNIGAYSNYTLPLNEMLEQQHPHHITVTCIKYPPMQPQMRHVAALIFTGILQTYPRTKNTRLPCDPNGSEAVYQKELGTQKNPSINRSPAYQYVVRNQPRDAASQINQDHKNSFSKETEQRARLNNTSTNEAI